MATQLRTHRDLGGGWAGRGLGTGPTGKYQRGLGVGWGVEHWRIPELILILSQIRAGRQGFGKEDGRGPWMTLDGRKMMKWGMGDGGCLWP